MESTSEKEVKEYIKHILNQATPLYMTSDLVIDLSKTFCNQAERICRKRKGLNPLNVANNLAKNHFSAYNRIRKNWSIHGIINARTNSLYLSNPLNVIEYCHETIIDIRQVAALLLEDDHISTVQPFFPYYKYIYYGRSTRFSTMTKKHESIPHNPKIVYYELPF